jgi:hypothetical protein
MQEAQSFADLAATSARTVIRGFSPEQAYGMLITTSGPAIDVIAEVASKEVRPTTPCCLRAFGGGGSPLTRPRLVCVCVCRVCVVSTESNHGLADRDRLASVQRESVAGSRTRVSSSNRPLSATSVLQCVVSVAAAPPTTCHRTCDYRTCRCSRSGTSTD